MGVVRQERLYMSKAGLVVVMAVVAVVGTEVVAAELARPSGSRGRSCRDGPSRNGSAGSPVHRSARTSEVGPPLGP